jgi:hypothetical protein
MVSSTRFQLSQVRLGGSYDGCILEISMIWGMTECVAKVRVIWFVGMGVCIGLHRYNMAGMTMIA